MHFSDVLLLVWSSEAAAAGPCAVADGGCPAGVSRGPAGRGRDGLSGSHGPEEAPSGGNIQPQSTGSSWSPTRDGQRAEGASGGETDLTSVWNRDASDEAKLRVSSVEG